MTQDFYQLRIKYLGKDGSVFVDYVTVGAESKESLSRSISYYRNKHSEEAAGDVEILVKDICLGNTYFD